MLDRGQLGEPYYMYTQRVNLGIVRQNENAWWSLAPHDISVICHLLGSEPVSVAAHGQCYLQRDIEDVVFATIKFADGKMAHVHGSWLDPHKIRKMTVVGPEKMVTFDDMEATEKIRVYDKGAAVRHDITTSYADIISLRFGDIVIPKIPGGEPSVAGMSALHRVRAGQSAGAQRWGGRPAGRAGAGGRPAISEESWERR